MATADCSAPHRRTPPSRHGAAYAAVWGAGFLILRIFAVSGYDWHTAFAVSTTLSLQDGVPLLFGSLMAGHVLTALMLMAVLPLLIAAGLWGTGRNGPLMLLLVVLGLLLLVALTASFHYWWLPPATCAVFGAFALTHLLSPQHRARRLEGAALTGSGWLSGMAVLVVAALVPTPWVPLERIHTRSGTIAGYVLSVDPGYLNVLTDQHEFVIILSSDVLARD